jgi:hypothetical protein
MKGLLGALLSRFSNNAILQSILCDKIYRETCISKYMYTIQGTLCSSKENNREIEIQWPHLNNPNGNRLRSPMESTIKSFPKYSTIYRTLNILNFHSAYPISFIKRVYCSVAFTVTSSLDFDYTNSLQSSSSQEIEKPSRWVRLDIEFQDPSHRDVESQLGLKWMTFQRIRLRSREIVVPTTLSSRNGRISWRLFLNLVYWSLTNVSSCSSYNELPVWFPRRIFY